MVLTIWCDGWCVRGNPGGGVAIIVMVMAKEMVKVVTIVLTVRW